MVPDGHIIGISWWVFELVIFGFLLLAGALVAETIALARKHRWTWKHVGALVLLVGAWCVIFYGSLVEPRILTVQEQYIDIARGNADREVRVLVVADPHVGPYKKETWARKVVDRVNEIDAEVVLMPGDFVFGKTDEVEMLSAFADINKPVYAVLGNHDHQFADEDAIAEQLEEWGIVMLRDASEPFVFESGAVANIVGIDDLWMEPNPVAALADIQADQPTILLSHNPDYILDPTAEQVDLVISGHTHCGQIRLPAVGPVPPLPTTLGRAWDCGLFDYNGGQLWITPGVGETGPRARLFNPPTIDVLTIKL